MSSFNPFPNLPVRVRQFVLLSIIGQGAKGVVYKATSLTYNIDFAIKVMPVKSTGPCSEIDALKNLDHNNIIRLYDYFEENSCMFLILEYCENGTLEERITKKGLLTKGKQVQIFYEIVSALCYCHSHNIAHRDLKTSNVLFDSYDRVKIADFGLCAQTEGNMKLKVFNGTKPYIPPEIFKRIEYDPFMADIWSLGVLLYRMATCQFPWPMDSVENMKNAIHNCQYLYLSLTHPLGKSVKEMIVLNPSNRITIHKLDEIAAQLRNEFPIKEINSLKPLCRFPVGISRTFSKGLMPNGMKKRWFQTEQESVLKSAVSTASLTFIHNTV